MKSAHKSDTRRVFFPSDDAQSDYQFLDEGERLAEFSPIPEDCSPLNFHLSNPASPFLGKRPVPIDLRTPPSQNSPTRKPDRSPTFKLNHSIIKSTTAKSHNRFRDEPCKPLNSFDPSSKPNDLEPHTPLFYQPKDQDLMSQVPYAESTAIASDSRAHRQSFLKDNAVNLLSCEEEIDEGLPNGPISVKRLIKMEPLCALMTAYFDNRDCSEQLEAVDKDYEFQILSFLFTFLQLRYTNSGSLTLREKMARLLCSQPNRPKKRQKIIQTIFVHIIKLMQGSFARGMCRWACDPSVIATFYNNYFHNMCPSERELQDEFDYTKNMKNGNLPYTFIQKLFKCQNFARDFLAVLHNEYLGRYRLMRARKLELLFTRWENVFLESGKEEQAVERVRQEVKARHFRLAWTDAELTSFFNFFDDLAA